MKTVGVENFNRLHPSSLARSSALPVAAGAAYGEARLMPERRRPDSGTRFDFGDADGNMRGGTSTEDGSGDNSDHWQDQGVHDLGPHGYEKGEVLSVEDMRNRARQKWRSRFF